MLNYRDLKVWQKAHQLALDVYRETRSWPREELYGLTNQVRRAAASVPTNLAEGAGRYGNAEMARFARIALGSATEVDYELLLARDLGYLATVQQAKYEERLGEIRRMLTSLIQKLAPSA